MTTPAFNEYKQFGFFALGAIYLRTLQLQLNRNLYRVIPTIVVDATWTVFAETTLSSVSDDTVGENGLGTVYARVWVEVANRSGSEPGRMYEWEYPINNNTWVSELPAPGGVAGAVIKAVNQADEMAEEIGNLELEYLRTSR